MTKVFYCDILNSSVKDEDFTDFSSARQNYVMSITNSKRKAQSYYVWRLLLKACELRGYSKVIDYDVKSGKCILEGLYISLTHSDSIVAVAISDDSVGVDVEKILDKILKLENRFLPNIEYSEDKKTFLTKRWTEEESLFKSTLTKAEFASKIVFDSESNQYILTVASAEKCTEFIKIDLNEIT